MFSLSATMAEQIKLLKLTQKMYQDMGIYPPQSNQNRRSINWRNIFMLVSFIQLLISSFAFLIDEADSIVDAGTSFYVAITELCCIVYYLINMWKIPKILKLIEHYENFIEKSKFDLISLFHVKNFTPPINR